MIKITGIKNKDPLNEAELTDAVTELATYGFEELDEDMALPEGTIVRLVAMAIAYRQSLDGDKLIK